MEGEGMNIQAGLDTCTKLATDQYAQYRSTYEVIQQVLLSMREGESLQEPEDDKCPPCHHLKFIKDLSDRLARLENQIGYSQFEPSSVSECKPEWYYKGLSGTTYNPKYDPEVTCWKCGKTFLCDPMDASCRLCNAFFRDEPKPTTTPEVEYEEKRMKVMEENCKPTSSKTLPENIQIPRSVAECWLDYFNSQRKWNDSELVLCGALKLALMEEV
jgi:hypothetical protein